MFKLLCFLLSCVFLLTGLVKGQYGTCSGDGCRCDSYDCCLELKENSVTGTHIGSVTIDPNLEPPYQDIAFIKGEPLATNYMFLIETDGNLTVNTTTDRETLGAERDCVKVFINGANSNTYSAIFAFDIVDVNDNPPEFSSPTLSISVPETTPSNTEIVCNAQLRNTLEAQDLDTGVNSAIVYSLRDTTLFEITNPEQPCFSSNDTGSLDRDDPGYRPYNFTLVATDQGDPPMSSTVLVTLSLTGVNEFDPTIVDTEVHILEMMPPGTLIQQLQIEDLDLFELPQQMSFTILGGIALFSINETTGELFTTQVLDAETTNNLDTTIEIEVCDMGEPVRCTDGSVTVIVDDVNEPATIIPINQIIVKDDSNRTSSSSLHLVRVMDADTAYSNVSFEVISGGDKFGVRVFLKTEPTTIFEITEISNIDRETETPFNLTLRLIEEGVPRLTDQILTIPVEVADINDNRPDLSRDVFNYVENNDNTVLPLGQYHTDLDEGRNAELASIVLDSANDAHGNNILEAFSDSNGGLELGPQGNLTIPVLDREIVGDTLRVHVNITDNGDPPLCRLVGLTINVQDVNDNKPVFEDPAYDRTIFEDVPIGTEVINVIATDQDKDNKIIYSLDSNVFTIDERGLIRTSVQLDREETANYALTVTASDNETAQFSTATVLVTIGDIDDNDPEFITSSNTLFTVPVGSPIGTIITTINATDKDEGLNAEIEFSFVTPPPRDLFEILKDGVVRVKGTLANERELNLTVQAINPNSKRSSEINILVSIKLPDISFMEAIIIGISAFVIVVILVLLLVGVIFCYCKKRRGIYDVKKSNTHLNNLELNRMNSIKKPILKSVPAAPANGSSASKERVQVKFSDRVDETHYEPQGAVTDEKVLRKASITNFGNTDSPQVPTRGSPVHNGIVPASPTAIMDLDHSPGQHINGLTNDIGMHPISSYEMHHMRPHSPMQLRREMNDNVEYSQGTGSTTDVNSYNSGDSTFSDGASNMNTSIPCFAKDEHPSDLHGRYGPPPSHPPIYPHMHTHTSHMPSSNLLNEIIYPGKISSLAADSSYTSSQGNGYPPRHSENPSNSDSSQTTTPSPHPRHEMMARIDPGPVHPIHPHANGHYPRQLVMPDAYPPPAPLPEIHRQSYNSFSDFEETSTYASMELDEALHYDHETEPGFYSLTATDYGDHEDT